MSSLSASLSTALSGLLVEQGALQVTTNNVANVNTPGYSREAPVLVSSDPVVLNPLTFGTGVSLQNVQSITDPLLSSQVQQQTQAQGQFSALASSLQQTQVNFTSSSNDIGSEITNFFNSVNQLSTNPSDLSLRQAVLTAAGNLATSFNTASANLTQQQTSLDLNAVQTVGQINQLSQQIANLNAQVSNLENVGESAGTFVDQRTEAINQLSALVDVSVIPSGNTLVLTTANGAPLVTGQESFQLTTQTNAAGLHDVYSQGNDITSEITSGQLGGTIQARDQEIPETKAALDTLAAGLANAVNTVQAGGFDLNGKAGTNLFTPPPVSGVGAAAALSVAITDPALIAASSDGTVGSNGNAQAMYALSSLPLVNGQSPIDNYSGIVFDIGNDAANASAESSASSLVVQQLTDQLSSVSGVSLDEEAANMVRYQDAYQASAQVITTINDMMYTVVNMSTLTG